MRNEKYRDFETKKYYVRIRVSEMEDGVTFLLKSDTCQQSCEAVRHFGAHHGSLDCENFVENLNLDDLQSDIEDWLEEQEKEIEENRLENQYI